MAKSLPASALDQFCANHRYILTRGPWLGGRGRVNFIMLNPSTADDVFDDPTVRKCIGFAKRWGYSSLVVTNLFAFRSTKPSDLAVLLTDNVNIRYAIGGQDNINGVLCCARTSDAVVCAWGSHPNIVPYAAETLEGLHGIGNLRCIGYTQDGNPKHPSRAPYTDRPLPFCVSVR